jgi:predicted CXXCH cytochrome family protein
MSAHRHVSVDTLPCTSGGLTRLDLKNFWKMEQHKAGEANFVDSLMYRRGVTCFSCHDPHGSGNNADLVKPAQQLCPCSIARHSLNADQN